MINLKAVRLAKRSFPVLLIVVFFGVYEVGNIFSIRPTSVHIWRQTDCASLAYMYYAKDLSLLEPEMHNYISDDGTSGRTLGEFTGLYWLVGKLYTLFGFHEFIYRLVGIILFMLALWAVFDLVTGLTHEPVWGYIVAGFLATSPILVFYSSAFLTNVPALSFVLIGWWALWKNHKQKGGYIVLAATCFALGGLLKITALVSVIALFGWWLSERTSVFNKLLGAPKLNASWRGIIFFTVIFGAIISWYAYVKYYVSSEGLGKYTFNNVWPIWEMSDEARSKAISFAVDIIVYQAMSPIWWFIIALSTIIVLVFAWGKLSRYLLFLILTAIGFGLYLSMWFNALDGHDYYVINIMLLPAMVLLGLALFSKKVLAPIRAGLKILLLIATLWNIGYASNNFKMRYWPEFDKSIDNSSYFGEPVEVGYWRYFGEHRDYDVYHDLETKLEAWGIHDSDIVISLPDPSFCISLYLMNREGFSGMSCRLDSSAVSEKISRGAKYLIVNDQLLDNQSFLEAFKQHPVGSYETISVYNLTQTDRK